MSGSPAELTLPRPGDVVDRYEVIAEVARGGMAAVYAVRRSGIGGFDKVLALKMVLPSLAGEEQVIERFLDEARIASRISHPSVIQVLDVGTHGGLPYLIMEFLRGQSLSATSRKAKQGRHSLSMAFRLGVLAAAAEGLAAAHQTLGADGKPLGLVHRDVSPQNVHLGYNGEVKVVDFGIAAARGRIANTQRGEFRGKLAYAAPEQMHREAPVDARADVWALGVVAWELLAGRRLFRGEDDAQTIYNVLHLEVPSMASVSPEVPGAVGEFVMRCLSRDVAARPSDLTELAHLLHGSALSARVGRRSEIAAEMDVLFRGDRAREDERMLAAERGNADLPIQAEATGGGSLTALSQDRGPVRRRPLLWLGLGVAVLGVVGLGALWRSSPVAPGAGVAASAHAPSATPAASAPAADVAVQHIRLLIPAGVKLVLVDGTRHDERPVKVALRPGEQADVQLVAGDGRVLDRKVSAADDGAELSLPATAVSAVPQASAPPSQRPERSPPRPPSTPGKKPTGPLLSDPY